MIVSEGWPRISVMLPWLRTWLCIVGAAMACARPSPVRPLQQLDEITRTFYSPMVSVVNTVFIFAARTEKWFPKVAVVAPFLFLAVCGVALRRALQAK